MKYVICMLVMIICVYVILYYVGQKKVFNKLEDTLEQQERKETRFEMCFKLIPPLLLMVMGMVCAYLKYKNII